MMYTHGMIWTPPPEPASPWAVLWEAADRLRWGTRTTRSIRGPGPRSCAASMTDHVHLLFLPAYSPELQPAEHLWPLTYDALANAHFRRP
jgi:hypothetical protein